MGIDDADVRDLGLDLKQTPDTTELRLPSAIGCASGAGPGLFGLVALLFLAFLIGTAWRAPERPLVPIAIASTVAIGLLLLLHRMSRWLGYGAVVRVTPDRLSIRKHRSGGEEAIAIAPGHLSTTTEAYIKELAMIKRLGDEYFRAHSIQPVKKQP